MGVHGDTVKMMCYGMWGALPSMQIAWLASEGT